MGVSGRTTVQNVRTGRWRGTNDEKKKARQRRYWEAKKLREAPSEEHLWEAVLIYAVLLDVIWFLSYYTYKEVTYELLNYEYNDWR